MKQITLERKQSQKPVSTSQVYIYDGDLERVKVFTFRNSSPEMHIELVEEKRPLVKVS